MIHRLRRHLRRCTWLALVAMLALALAPSVSQALDARAAGFGTDICSVASNAGGPPGSDGTALHVEHCALCGVASHAIALPPAAPAELPVPDGADHVAALFLAAAHAPFAWRPPQARAPPPIS